jgi:hypothetical protein
VIAVVTLAQCDRSPPLDSAEPTSTAVQGALVVKVREHAAWAAVSGDGMRA